MKKNQNPLKSEQLKELKKRGFQITHLETPNKIDYYVTHHKLICMYHTNSIDKAFKDLDALHPKQLELSL